MKSNRHAMTLQSQFNQAGIIWLPDFFSARQRGFKALVLIWDSDIIEGRVWKYEGT